MLLTLKGDRMSNAIKANDFLNGLGDDSDAQLKAVIAAIKKAPKTPDSQMIVYYVGDKPDTVWEYIHKPSGGTITDINGAVTGDFKPYGRLYGYWESDPDNAASRKFVEHKSKNLKLMPFDTFMDNVVPNKNCTKIFDSEADFLLDLI